jgi:hypothetical protein
MATIFFSVISGFELYFVNIIIKEEPGAIGTAYSVGLGLPSTSTMVSFIFIALAGLIEPLAFNRGILYLASIGLIVTLIGAIALIGYSVNIPLLFYYIPGKSSAIAINTASLLVIWGLGLMMLCCRSENASNSK